MGTSALPRVIAASIAVVAVCLGWTSTSAGAWREFSAESGLRLSYPANWFRIPDSRILFITSSRRRVEAVVIPRGAQMIEVREGALGDDDLHASEYDYILARWKIHLQPKADLRRCADVVVVESSDEVGPNTFYLEHHFYCKIRNRLFVLSLTQWKSDKVSKAAYSIAVKMLRTFRIR